MYLIDVDLDLVVSIDELSKIVCIWASSDQDSSGYYFNNTRVAKTFKRCWF
jgi:hypothetical protein